MASSSGISATSNLQELTSSSRFRLYGMCLILGLSFLFIGRITHNAEGWAEVYLPLAGAVMLVISLAGAEFQLYLENLGHEKLIELKASQDSAHAAVERQRAFNQIWQQLADTRHASDLSADVLVQLAGLFDADLTVVWAAAPGGGYHLLAAHQLGEVDTDRLSKIGQVAPCFALLEDRQQQVQINDFRKQTAPALAWFCDDRDLQCAVFNPVLVRQELVGVLAFFYHEKTPTNSMRAEEMQSAANLFLCAL